mmetsp:Transcript_13170/g.27887  ORF Transcript_13170/g.27887 Transcript_13170/m.27887 type:complete len:207 (+) Transcript_13170:347-967(+)
MHHKRFRMNLPIHRDLLGASHLGLYRLGEPTFHLLYHRHIHLGRRRSPVRNHLFRPSLSRLPAAASPRDRHSPYPHHIRLGLFHPRLYHRRRRRRHDAIRHVRHVLPAAAANLRDRHTRHREGVAVEEEDHSLVHHLQLQRQRGPSDNRGVRPASSSDAYPPARATLSDQVSSQEQGHHHYRRRLRPVPSSAQQPHHATLPGRVPP